MSRASEWSKRFGAARDEFYSIQMKRPEGAWLKLSPGRTLSVSVGNDGEPIIECPLLMSEQVTAADLCDFARGILRAFSSEAPR